MALARTTRVGAASAINFGTGAYTPTGATFTPANNSILVACVEVGFSSSNGTWAPTISDTASGVWTQRASATSTAGSWASGIRLWTCDVVTGTSRTVSFDQGTVSVDGGYAVSILEYIGQDPTTPQAGATAKIAAGTDGADSVTVGATPVSADVELGFCGREMNAGTATTTQGATFTELQDFVTSAGVGMETQERTASTSTSVDWADLNTAAGNVFRIALAGIIIKSAASTGTVAVTLGSFTSAASGTVTLPAGLPGVIAVLNPVGYWKLDETSGTVATDSSGNARHGTYTGSVTVADTAGPSGTGSYPTFAGGYVTIPDNNAWSINTSTVGLTVFCIVRPTALTLGMFASKGAAAAYEWQFTVGTPTDADLAGSAYNAAASNNVNRVVVDAVTVNTWQAVAWATPHDPGAGGAPDLNRNGSNLTGTTNTPAISMTNGTAALIIGHRADLAAGHDFTGAIAHVAIFPTRLSGGDMTTLMTAANSWLTGDSITGTVAVTLGAFVAAATGTATPPPITGTAAVTLAAFVSNASGTVTGPGVTGTVAVTLAAFTSSASGTYTPPPVTGTVAVTLGVFVVAASGTVAGPGAIAGTAAITLGPFTSTASGTVGPAAITGTVATTLAAFTSSAAGTVGPAAITGTVAVTLDPFICVAFDVAPPISLDRTFRIRAEGHTYVIVAEGHTFRIPPAPVLVVAAVDNTFIVRADRHTHIVEVP